jgi:hypothetical protein
MMFRLAGVVGSVRLQPDYAIVRLKADTILKSKTPENGRP